MRITSDISKVFLVLLIVITLSVSSQEPAFAESSWRVEFVGGDKKLDSPMLKVKYFSLKKPNIQPLSDDKFLWSIVNVSKATAQTDVPANASNIIKLAKEGMEVEYSLHFSPPYFEDIKALENCKGTVSLLGRTDISCTAKRYKRKKVSRNTLIERHCTSSMTLKSKNYFMVVGEHKGIIIDSKSSEQNEHDISKD